ncbi:MAG: ATP-binding protein, partial [Acidimicrobiia bacterium]
TRGRYIAHLGELRRDFEAAATAQRVAAAWRDPAPEVLWSVARDRRRLWERRPGDPDFLAVRVGLGRVPLELVPTLAGAANPMTETDSVCQAAATHLQRRWSSIGGQPLALPLTAIGSLVVRGPRRLALGATRALVAQAATLHAPEDVHVAVATTAARLEDWEWCKWLPHAEDVDLADGTGPGRLVAATYEELDAAVHQEIAARRGSRAGETGPHLLVVVDGQSGEARAARRAEARQSGATGATSRRTPVRNRRG